MFDKRCGEWEYGVGGGVVWDSTVEGEYEECRTKAAVLLNPTPDFKLLETIRWSPDEGFFLLDRHLARLQDSAEYFDYDVRIQDVRNALEAAVMDCSQIPKRVRLLADAQGRIEVEVLEFTPWKEGGELSVALAVNPVDPKDRFLYHKTTRREVYEAAHVEHPDCDEVLLWNPDGFVTEGTRSNVAVEMDGKLWTPPVSCGLLPGTLRARMLEAGELVERLIRVEDLDRVGAIYLLNSLRGMARARLVQRIAARV